MAKAFKLQPVEKWGMFEVSLKGPAGGKAFMDVQMGAEFTFKNQTVPVDGFYDGNGVYRVRFMPDLIGPWSYVTRSNVAALDGLEGQFNCVEPAGNNHGPVDVFRYYHFAYADGTRHYSFGTTCYAWIHQPLAIQAQTLRTLARSPFNKIRMCIFPKHYLYNENDPPFYVFPAGKAPRNGKYHWDFTRFDVRFFRLLDRRIADLMKLGIEADLILFHPYDRWGFADLTARTEERYLKYLIARVSAFRNVWWSMANEWDFMKTKTSKDFDRYFSIVQAYDPYNHLRSVHNGTAFYDHSKRWVTHVSVQHSDLTKMSEWRVYKKPVVVDECCYEGNIERRWGNITGRELVHRFWQGVVYGGYVGHGETFVHPKDILWWSKGGKLYGQSPRRIAFLRKILEQAPRAPLEPISMGRGNDALARPGQYYLFYYGDRQPALMPMDFPQGAKFKAEIIDTWKMTITPVKGVFSGKFVMKLLGKPYMAVRYQKIE